MSAPQENPPGRLRRAVRSPFVVMPVVGALALGGWTTYRTVTDDGEEAAVATMPTEQVVEVTVGSLDQTVAADGTVANALAEDLSFTSSGEITSVDVAAGDVVTEGQVLATIDDADLAADVAAAETDLADAEAALADAEDADASDAQVAAAESSVEVAGDRLDDANEALEGAQLVAPISGTVASVSISAGEELDSGTGATSTTGSGSGSGQSAGDVGSGSGTPDGAGGQGAQGGDTTSTTPHIQIVSTDVYSVELALDDADAELVEVGQTAAVSLSTSTSSQGGFGGGFGGGPPGMTQAPSGGGGATDEDAAAETEDAPAADVLAEGVVTEVGTIADASSGVAQYPVTIVFTDESGDLVAGSSVTVDITYSDTGDVLQVPSRAVTTATDGATTVEVDLDGEAGGDTEERTVTTGTSSGGMIEITDGLAEGEFVVIAGFGGRGGTGEMPTGEMPTGEMPTGGMPSGEAATDGEGG